MSGAYRVADHAAVVRGTDGRDRYYYRDQLVFPAEHNLEPADVERLAADGLLEPWQPSAHESVTVRRSEGKY